MEGRSSKTSKVGIRFKTGESIPRLASLVDSNSIVVVGASPNPSKTGSALIKILMEMGFRGRVAGVNPKGGEIHGCPLYKNITEVPFDIDLAVLLISPQAIPQVVEDCGQKGVKGIVINAEGFAETGQEGAALQDRIEELIGNFGIRALGPNTTGIINTTTKLTTSYFVNENMLKQGEIGSIAQSGIFAGALLKYLGSFASLGISKSIGLGNKIDVDEIEALEYLANDPQTSIIQMYLEGIKDGRRFLEIAGKVSPQKPIVLLKGGRTKEGALAATTHTASLAGNHEILTGALRQAGVILAEDLNELIGIVKALYFMPLPRGNRMAIITYSGAQAIMTIDACSANGLARASFTAETQRRLSQVIKTSSKAVNPIDLYPAMIDQGYEKMALAILDALFEAHEVDGIIFINSESFSPEESKGVITKIKEGRTKPVYATFMGDRKSIESSRMTYDDHYIPSFAFPEEAVRTMAKLWKYTQFRQVKGNLAAEV
jgi:acyl-CoA synthetase (NDP forming)